MSDLPERVSFPKEEEKVLALWKELDAFKTSLRLSEHKPPYTFYDGPPFATGLPHYGHILAGTIKDVVTRYATQTGHYVSRRFGWDCHGLPVEYEIDQKLGIVSPDQVIEMGIATYNGHCRSIVSRYCEQWEEIVTRLGRWIDFKNDYKTMEPWYMESVWWVFKTIFEKDLVYRGFKVMPYSTACHTPLSNFEANLNYKENTIDPAVVVTFPLAEDPEVSLVAWTTTPWTLPSNLALCVNPEMEYVRVKDLKTGKVYIVMEARLSQLWPKFGSQGYKGGEFEVLAKFVGASLVGTHYLPLFNYFESFRSRGAFRVVADSYVSNDAGTGIVHQAPAFGEDDFRVCCAAGIVDAVNLPCPVDDSGKFTSDVTDYVGMYIKDADDLICKALKANGRLYSKGSIGHSYPFCWRSDTPLIYRAVPSWFVKVEAIKEQLLANNEQTYWVPSFVKEKRFHNWLRDARDWAISRNRYWGTPLPIWTSDDGSEVVVVGSIEELQALTGATVTDLHRESIDGLTIPSKTGKGVLRRVPEVFDCWFESGSMPYAQVHYPFNKEVAGKWESLFPADFIAEGLDQTRGWFYTLMVLSTALFGKPAFKNLIVNGLVLAEDGKKMSKRLKNYPDPTLVVNNYGADALRLYLINSPVVKAEPLKFKEAGVFDVVKTVFLPWYNAFRFFTQNVTRLELAGVKFDPLAYGPGSGKGNVMDRWILAALADLVQFVRQEMAGYRLYTVVPRLVAFIDQLTNWYVRLNRRRLKGGDGPQEALVSLCALYDVLLSLCRLMAPFTPFFTETVYQHLRKMHPACDDATAAEDAVGRAASVHYLSIPEVDAASVDPAIVAAVQTLQAVVEAGRTVRTKRNITQKFPVTEVIVVSADNQLLDYARSLESYIKEELNALEVKFTNEDTKWCQLKAAPVSAVLGKRLGPAFKTLLPLIKELSSAAVQALDAAGSLEVGGHVVNKDEVTITRAFMGDTTVYDAANNPEGTVTVVLNHVLTDDLRSMGLARELVSHIQALRKASKLSVSDAVEVFIDVDTYDAVKAGTYHVPPPPIVIAETCSVKPKKSAAPVAAAGFAVDPAARDYVKTVVGKGFKAILEAVGSQVVPAVPATLPLYPVTLGKSVVEVGGALVTITVARPAVRFAPDDVLSAVAPGANLAGLKSYVSSMRFDKLKAHVGPLNVTVDKVPATLVPGVHFFLEPAQLVANTPSVQASLSDAGFAEYVASVKA